MKSLLAAAFLFVTVSGFGQDQQEKKPTIEVAGTAEIKIIPDEIYITINIEERESGRDKISVEEQESQLQKAVKDLGIPIKNLSLSGASSNYIKRSLWGSDVISQTEYILMVSNAREVGKVFEKLDELKIDNARIDRVDHSEMEKFKKEVRIMAIQAARDKADYLLEAIGQKRGKAIYIRENSLVRSDDSFGNANVIRSYEREMIQKSEDFERIGQFTELTLTASFYTEFEIN